MTALRVKGGGPRPFTSGAVPTGKRFLRLSRGDGYRWGGWRGKREKSALESAPKV